MVTAMAGAVGTAACAGKAANDRPPETAGAAVDDAAAGVLELYRFHHQGGVTLFIALSLDTLGVSPEQRAAVEKIRHELHAEMESARVAEQNLVTGLADGLAASSFDATKMDAAVGRVTMAAAGAHDASAEALNELHAVLTPPQRAALVDKVEAHWAVWRRANHERGAADKAEADHLDTLAAELELTADQEAKVRAALEGDLKSVPRPDQREIASRMGAFGEAFRRETFDAGSLKATNTTNADLAGWGAVHLVHLVETLSPVLTPDQRSQLAEQLRQHAAHNPSAPGNSSAGEDFAASAPSSFSEQPSR